MICKRRCMFHPEEEAMTQMIQKIVTILNGYGYGKLLALRKKNKFGTQVSDVVSISDEARRRFGAAEGETPLPPVDEVLRK